MLLLAAALALPSNGKAQTTASPAGVTTSASDGQPASRLAFEVATVKPNTTQDEPSVNFTLGPGETYTDTGGRMVTHGITLLDYIRFAYRLSNGEVDLLQSSAPGWIAADRFDVEARSAMPHPTKDQMRQMVQALLAERFHLTLHQETRTLSVLALVAATPGRLGPSLHPHAPSDTHCSGTPEGDTAKSSEGAAVSASPTARSIPAIPQLCGGLVSVPLPDTPSRVRIVGRHIPLALLAAQLDDLGHSGRPVLDRTGLTGFYDVTLDWDTAGVDPTRPPSPDDTEDTLRQALRQELGLKLQPTRAAMPVWVLDHIDRTPTQN